MMGKEQEICSKVLFPEREYYETGIVALETVQKTIQTKKEYNSTYHSPQGDCDIFYCLIDDESHIRLLPFVHLRWSGI